MIDTRDGNRALRISAFVYEWGVGSDGYVSVQNVAAPSYEHKRVKLIIGGFEIEVSAWDMIRAIKACAGVEYDD